MILLRNLLSAVMEKKLVNFTEIVLNTNEYYVWGKFEKQDRDDCHGRPNSEYHTLLNNNDTILTEEQIKAPHMKVQH